MSYIFSLIGIILLTGLIYTQQALVKENKSSRPSRDGSSTTVVIAPAPATIPAAQTSTEYNPVKDPPPDRTCDDGFPFLKTQSSLLRLLSPE